MQASNLVGATSLALSFAAVYGHFLGMSATRPIAAEATAAQELDRWAPLRARSSDTIPGQALGPQRGVATFSAIRPWQGWTILTGDLNGDGIPDHFIYQFATGNWIELVNYPDGTVQQFSGKWSPGWQVLLTDLNGDRLPDVFLYSRANGWWFKCINLAPGQFRYEGGTWNSGWRVYPVNDFDGDGRGDLFLYNAGSGAWVRAYSRPSGFDYDSGTWSARWDIYPADFNGDGRSDIFLHNQSGDWFVATFTGRNRGFGYEKGKWDTGWEVHVAKFDGDKRADIFLHNRQTGVWFECLKVGSGFTCYRGTWDRGWQVFITDLNDDQYSDVLVFNPVSNVWVECLNTAPGNFAYSQTKIAPDLILTLTGLPQSGKVAFIVTMKDYPDLEATAARLAGRSTAERGQVISDILRSVASRSQSSLWEYLDGEMPRGTVDDYVAMASCNCLKVTGTREILREIATRADVVSVFLDEAIILPLPEEATSIAPAAGLEWNIAKIGAHLAWGLGFKGKGAIAALIDTGADANHPDLRQKWAGRWQDFVARSPVPMDDNGHGSHVVGAILGGDASGASIGTAPEARWIACRAFDRFGLGRTSTVLACMDWVLAQGPDVVNNSWSAGVGCRTEHQRAVQAWRAANIFPAFAAGNSGPLPGTGVSPGVYPESIATGALNAQDDVAAFSSRGPGSCDGRIFPDVTAPGVAIRSAWTGGSYRTLSGTSMSCPHTSGTVALLRGARPGISVADLERILRRTATDLGPAGPDNSFGAGRIDAFRAVQPPNPIQPPPPPPSNRPPNVSDPRANPPTVPNDGSTETLLTAKALDEDGDLRTVTVALSSLGLEPNTPMYDDGSRGDSVPRDGTYTISTAVPRGATPGPRALIVTARDATDLSATATIQLTVSQAPQPPGGDKLFVIKWFNCDKGNENNDILQRDGTPVCGSSNCPGSPSICWGRSLAIRRFEHPSVSWVSEKDGSFRLSHRKDHQVYGETWLYVASAREIAVPYRADVGRIWLNDVDITDSTRDGKVPLNLRAGWTRLEFTAQNQNSDSSISFPFNFAANIDIMNSFPIPTFTVGGSVLDANGRGVQGVQVFVWDNNAGDGWTGAVSDGAGRFRIGLPAGPNYKFIFNPPCSSAFASESVDGVVGQSDASVAVNVRLSAGFAVRGAIAGPSGSPLGGGGVFAFHKSLYEAQGLPPADESGQYCVRLKPGCHELTFTPPERSGAGPRFFSNVCGPGDVTLDVRYPAGITFEGTVLNSLTGKGQAGVKIWCLDPAVGGFGFSPTRWDPSGLFAGTLPYGTYDCQFLASPFSGLESKHLVDLPGTADNRFTVTLGRGATAYGSLRLQDGTPLKRAFILAVPSRGREAGNNIPGFGDFSDDRGVWEISLTPDTYRFLVYPPPGSGLKDQATGEIQVSQDVRVELTASTNTPPSPPQTPPAPTPPAEPPRVIIDRPNQEVVGLTVTFRWRIENAKPGETYRSQIYLDKGVNACDGQIEEAVDAGNQTSLTISLDPGRYAGQSVDFAIRVSDSRGTTACQPGRRFRVDPGVATGNVSIIEPKNGEAVDNIVSVKGYVRTLAAGEFLAALVRPIPQDTNQSWWVQASPQVNADRTWVSSPVYIGQPSDVSGLPLKICAVITTTELNRGQQLRSVPPGPSACVDVTRK